MWILLVTLLFIANVTSIRETFVVTECYGKVLSISCKGGHRIKVLDDFFGVSSRKTGADVCRYVRGDCTVTNSRHSSVVHRYCEGKQTCTSFQVDRRYCQNNQTSYEQVEYECIPDVEVTNICTTTSYTAASGYLATPNFPNEYPPDMRCVCSLVGTDVASKIQMQAVHFIVKYDRPCRDWVEIGMENGKRRLCGAYRSTLLSSTYNLTFNSDHQAGHQGLWLYFSVHPISSNGSIEVSCKRVYPTQTPVNTSVTSSVPVLTDRSTATPGDMLWNTIATSTAVLDTTTNPVTNSSKIIKTEPSITETKPRKTVTERNDILKHTFRNTETIHNAVFNIMDEEADGQLINKENDTVLLISSSPTKMEESIPNEKTKKNLQPTKIYLRPDLEEAITKNMTDSLKYNASDLNKAIRDGNNINEKGFGIGMKEQDKYRTTGIIIISVCVGGVVLLAFIVGTLVCISKSTRPAKRQNRSNNDRLQSRLNSLSFYESIPLYESIGRKRMAPRPPITQNIIQPMADCNNSTAQPLNANNLLNIADDHYWAIKVQPADMDSDHDSAIYAELDRHSRDLSDDETPSSPDENTHQPDDFRSYALTLQPHDKQEDIYTHV